MALRGAHHRKPNDPFRNLPSTGSTELWVELATGRTKLAIGSSSAAITLDGLQTVRQGNDYPKSRHRQGSHFIDALGKHVYVESQLESLCILIVEHLGGLTDLVTQPLCVVTPEGTRIYPDFAYQRAEGVICVVDVKPVGRITLEAEAKFAAVREVCARIGWPYDVMTGLEGVEANNFLLMSCFRGRENALDDEHRLALAAYLTAPRRFGDAASHLMPEHPARAKNGIHHAMWNREVVRLDPSQPHTNASLIGLASS